MRDRPDDEAERTKFVTVMRGYDRIEVDEHVRRTQRTVTQLGAQLADSEVRRQRAEQRVHAVESEVREIRAQLAARPSAPEEGFGMRAERLLRIAEQEASEIRTGASKEAAATVQQGRADAERRRHETEQALIARSTAFEEQVGRRTTELQQREQQIAAQLAAARNEAEAVEAAARRAADQYRRRVEADAEEVRARVAAEAAQIREQAAQELARLTDVQDGVRAELARLNAVLAQEARARTSPGERSPSPAPSGEESRGRAADAEGVDR